MFTVYFRTGGTDNFKWHFVGDIFSTKDSAQSKAQELKNAGYIAYVADYVRMHNIGLPETFE